MNLHILHNKFIFVMFMRCYFRLKKDGKTTKEVPFVRSGFNAFIDNFFRYLPFFSVKQAATVLEKIGRHYLC